jgi:hypothetical protein
MHAAREGIFPGVPEIPAVVLVLHVQRRVQAANGFGRGGVEFGLAFGEGAQGFFQAVLFPLFERIF